MWEDLRRVIAIGILGWMVLTFVLLLMLQDTLGVMPIIGAWFAAVGVMFVFAAPLGLINQFVYDGWMPVWMRVLLWTVSLLSVSTFTIVFLIWIIDGY